LLIREWVANLIIHLHCNKLHENESSDCNRTGGNNLFTRPKVFKSKREHTLENIVQNALEQIMNQGYDVEFLSREIKPDRIRYYGFAFRGKEVLINGVKK